MVLTEKEKTKKLSIAEGSSASLMIGFGEQYIVPFALRLGASGAQLGFLSAVPAFIASLFQLLGAQLTEKHMNRKKLVSRFVLWQAITFIPLFILPYITKNFWVLVLCFTMYLSFGNLLGPAWSSWLGDLIPQSERNKSLKSPISLARSNLFFLITWIFNKSAFRC